MVSDNKMHSIHRTALLSVAVAALADGGMARPVTDAEMFSETEPEPLDQADKAALAKAEAKRQRRREKRLRNKAAGSVSDRERSE